MLYTPVISAWPAAGLVSLEEARVFLKLVPPGGDSSEVHPEDDYILSLIKAARASVSSFTCRMTADVTGVITLNHIPECLEISRKAVSGCTVDYFDSNDQQHALPFSSIKVVRSAVFDTIHITGSLPEVSNRPDAVSINVELMTDTEYADILKLAIQKNVTDWFEERENDSRSMIMVTTVERILKPIRIWSS